MFLSHTYDTHGNYGQYEKVTDFVQVDGKFIRCDDLDGAVITDESANSRKNIHEKIVVECQLRAGTLGKTVEDSASSSNTRYSVQYWRVSKAGDKMPVSHTEETHNEQHVATIMDVLEDGEEILVARTPRGVRLNSYKGNCCDCGRHVASKNGELVKMHGRWTVRCVECFVDAKQEATA